MTEQNEDRGLNEAQKQAVEEYRLAVRAAVQEQDDPVDAIVELTVDLIMREASGEFRD